MFRVLEPAHSSLAVFRLVDCLCPLPCRRSGASCDWAISGSTTVYLKHRDGHRG